MEGEAKRLEDDWILTKFMSKQIKNESAREVFHLFGQNLNLEQYWLAIFNAEYGRYILFRFLSCDREPLRGGHYIYADRQVLHISSPGYFKQSYLGLSNKLSFDRSTFIVLFSHRKLVRLHTVRVLISLPLSADLTTRCTPKDIKQWEEIPQQIKLFIDRMYLHKPEDMPSAEFASFLHTVFSDNLKTLHDV